MYDKSEEPWDFVMYGPLHRSIALAGPSALDAPGQLRQMKAYDRGSIGQGR